MNDTDDPGASEPRLDLSALGLSPLEEGRLLRALEQRLEHAVASPPAPQRSRTTEARALLDMLVAGQPHARRLMLASLALTLCAVTLSSVVIRPRARERLDWIESSTILRSGADVRRYWLEARGGRR